MSVCFVVLVIQHATRMLHIVICDLSGPKLFFTFLKDAIFDKKNLLNLKRVFRVSVQLFSETFLFIKRTERDMMYYIGIHVKYPLFLSDIKEN